MNEKRLPKREPFFVMSKHRANWIFHKFTFSSWLQQILILGDSSQKELLFSELPQAFLKHVMAHSLLKLCKFIIPNILPKQTAKNISPDYKEIFQILCCNGRQNKENSKDQ